MAGTETGIRKRRGRLASAAAVLVPTLALITSVALRAAAPETPRPTIPGKFVWHDLLTTDSPAVEKFYAGLFGWTFEAQKGRENPYKAIRLAGVPIGGIVDVSAMKADAPSSTWLNYVSVADVDKTVAAMRSRNCKVLREPGPVGSNARAAVVVDPQGAILGLAKIAKGDPPDADVVPEGSFLWMEYVAEDAAGAITFYKDALGYTAERIDGGAAVEYYALKAGDKPRAGLYPRPWKEVRSNWLPYVRVADAAAAAKKAESLGGRILLAPKPEVRNGTLAIVTDPSGAALALQKWPIDEPAK
ncbi:MAG: VOC family protein [Holophagales bacterium]|nr:VOC family protein [Holophagales bacterium]